MDTDFIKQSLITANAIALNGVSAGQEMARMESRERIRELESEVLRLRELLREHGIEPPEGIEVQQ